MIQPARRVAWLTVLTAVAACAYYNGLYNANRLAAGADRAAREGRSGEARSLWAQAAVKAESVATRYPGSRHRDDALLLWGRALSETDNCTRAQRPLRLAIDSSPDPSVQRRARLVLGRCRVQLRQPDSAVAVLTPLLEGPDAEKLTSSALLWRGRAELQRGAARAAVRDLERTSHDAAAFDLALAHVALGDVEAAAGVLMARVVRPYDEDRWLRTLDSVGVRSPESVAQVVDRLIARNDLTQGERGRLLLADGRRWSREGETGRGGERYRAAIVAAPDSVEGAAAQALLAIGELQRTTDLESLARISDTLSAARARGGVAAQLAGPAAGILGDAVRVLQDSQPALGDLKMFVIAEALRDSLAASVPARSMFLELQRRYPSSTVAAKALLAAALIVPSQADSVRAVLDRLYPASPYALALRGEAGSQFAATEDSLRVLLARARGLLGMPSAIEAIAEEEIRRR